MATQIDELTRAAKDRGMTVERLGTGHQRITNGTSSVTIPSTPSDSRSWNNIVAELRRTFPELAEIVAPRPPKPMDPRPVKEKPMQVMEEPSAATLLVELNEARRAPQRLDAGNGVTIEVIDIGADLARELLSKSSMERETETGTITVSNRKLRTDYVVVLRRQILNGLWKDAITTIHVAGTGRLLNAQHTLTALVSANRKQPGITIRAILVTGLPEEVISVIDTGRPRTLGDYLRLERNERYSAFLAGVLTAYGRLTQMKMLSDNRSKPTNLEALFLLDSHPEIRNAVRKVNIYYKQATKLLGPSLAGALMVMMDTIEPATENRTGGGEQVMQELHDGATDPFGPWATLREQLMWATRGDVLRPSPSDRYRWVALAWNADQGGTTLTRNQLRNSKGMPRLTGFPYGEVNLDEDI